MQGTLVIASVLSSLLWCAVHGKPATEIEYTLRNYEVERNITAGTYKFSYEVPGHSSRSELREESSEEAEDFEVEGSYSFTAPDGEKHKFSYEADEDGFEITSDTDSLPKHPEDTDAVEQAREAFFDAYCKVLQLAREDCEVDKFFREVEVTTVRDEEQ